MSTTPLKTIDPIRWEPGTYAGSIPSILRPSDLSRILKTHGVTDLGWNDFIAEYGADSALDGASVAEWLGY